MPFRSELLLTPVCASLLVVNEAYAELIYNRTSSPRLSRFLRKGR